MTRPKNTARPFSSPAGGHSDGGLSSSLPPGASRNQAGIYADDLRTMRIIEDFHEMERHEDRMPSGWWIVPFALAGALIGAGLGLLIIRWLI